MFEFDNCACSAALAVVRFSTEPFTDFADDNWLLEFTFTPSRFAMVLTVWLVETVVIPTPPKEDNDPKNVFIINLLKILYLFYIFCDFIKLSSILVV